MMREKIDEINFDFDLIYQDFSETIWITESLVFWWMIKYVSSNLILLLRSFGDGLLIANNLNLCLSLKLEWLEIVLSLMIIMSHAKLTFLQDL